MMDSFTKHPLLNGWALFGSLSAIVLIAMLSAAHGTDLKSPAGISQLIAYSVRWSVPFIYLVVAASALPTLLPGEGPRWLLRNRRYVGLVFAFAMAWQGVFIFLLTQQHRGFYYEDVYLLRNELEGSSGYIFLAAMVLTSFSPGKRLLAPRHWKTLHRSGVFFLWAYAFSVYWWNLFYYGNARLIDHAFYWAGFLAFVARLAAWGKKRRSRASKPPAPLAQKSGLALVLAGIIVAATGHLWYEPVSAATLAPAWSARLELWLPFWPFEPFYSLMLIGAGIGLASSIRPLPERGSAGARSETRKRPAF